MNIQTQFDLGQRVYRVGRQVRDVRQKCPTCEGFGRVSVTGADGIELCTYCPNEKCKGRGSWSVTHYSESRAAVRRAATEAESACSFVSAAGVRCHRAAGHNGGHKPYPVDWDLPADLAEVLRDQSIVVPQDAAVWETIGKEGLHDFQRIVEESAAEDA